jgi:DNA-directed RNA polymerase specialized sigma subunit
MSIIIKNSQLTNDTISALNTLIELDINATIAFRLTRIIKELSSIVDDKLKMEKKILDKWVEKDAEGNPIIPNDNDGNPIEGSVNITNVEEFTKEMSELMEIENEIPFDKINFDDLNLTTAKVKDLIKLEFLFN